MARLCVRPTTTRLGLRALARLVVILSLLLAIGAPGPATASMTDGHVGATCQVMGTMGHHADCGPADHHASCVLHAGCHTAFALPAAAEFLVQANPQRWTVTDGRDPAGRAPSVRTPPPIASA